MHEGQITPSNYTQTPNVVFDYWMSRLSPSSFKILACLCRKTFGWHKTSDTISQNQFVKCTGMTKPTVIKALEDLEKLGLVHKKQVLTEYGYQPNEYRLYIEKPTDEIYSEPGKNLEEDRSNSYNEVVKNLGGGGKNLLPGVVKNIDQGVVKNFNPQKKDYTKQNLQKDIARSRQSRSKPEDFFFCHDKKEFIGITSDDMDAWKTIYTHIDIDQEILKAKEWLLSNPTKGNKKLWRKFLIGWLNRSNDHAENKKAYRSNNQNSSYSSPLPGGVNHGDFKFDPIEELKNKIKIVLETMVYQKKLPKSNYYINEDKLRLKTSVVWVELYFADTACWEQFQNELRKGGLK